MEKALKFDIGDLDIWLMNAVITKARISKDKICKLALDDTAHEVLSISDKQNIISQLAEQGLIITSVKQLPEAIRSEIVLKAKFPQPGEVKEAVEGMALKSSLTPLSAPAKGFIDKVKGFIKKVTP